MSMPHVLSSCLYLADFSTVPLYKLVAMPNAFIPWWRHQMETFSALLAICAGNSPVPGEFPTQRPVTRSFDVFFDLRLNKRLSKHSWGWWFETLSRPLWRHCNDSGQWKTGIPHWWCDSPMHWRACVLTPCLEIGNLNYLIDLKFDGHIGSTAAEVTVKFQSDRTILNTNLAASRLHEILRQDVLSDIETGPMPPLSSFNIR